MGERVTSTPHPFILILNSSKDEDVPRTIRRSERVWVPAFAGNTEEGNKAPFDATHRFPQRGKISQFKIFPLWGKYRRSGGRGLWAPHHRVLASAAKQPRGLTRKSGDVPLGCFGAMRLAMTRKFPVHLHRLRRSRGEGFV